MSIQLHAATLALHEAVKKMADTAFTGNLMDGYMTGGVVKSGNEAAKRLREHVATVQRAIDYYEEVLAHFRSVGGKP